jgi:CTP synthase
MQLLGESGDYDIVITEIGGTVGDIESLPYIESVRQLIWDLGRENALVIHLTLIPYLAAAGELKTKPTQHSVKTLMESGISADIIVCRTEHELTTDLREKLALFCNVKKEAIIQSIDVDTIYDVPLKMRDEGLDQVVLTKLQLNPKRALDLSLWKEFLKKLKNPKNKLKIGLVGKYVELQDSYKSILESLTHAGAINETEIEILSIHSEDLEDGNQLDQLKTLEGLIVAPGFGERGIEGKIEAIAYARANKLPFFGICLGMQMAVIEYARNQKGIQGANSTEMEPHCKAPVIDLMESQKNIKNKGGTMRLGLWDCQLTPNSKAAAAYQKERIAERHRHRYEFNNDYAKQIFDANFMATGTNPETGLVEIIEYKEHPWFMGVQFHPEYKSTVSNPHPLFSAFIKACLEEKAKKI